MLLKGAAALPLPKQARGGCRRRAVLLQPERKGQATRTEPPRTVMHPPLNSPHASHLPAGQPDLPADGGHDLDSGPLAIVGGCGHVGLPLALAFARKGYSLDLLSTSAVRYRQVKSVLLPFL